MVNLSLASVITTDQVEKRVSEKTNLCSRANDQTLGRKRIEISWQYFGYLPNYFLHIFFIFHLIRNVYKTTTSHKPTS